MGYMTMPHNAFTCQFAIHNWARIDLTLKRLMIVQNED